MKKKLLSWLLVVALVITMVPGQAFASSGGDAGTLKTSSTNTVVAGTNVTWTEGTWTVNENVEFNSTEGDLNRPNRVKVQGNVTLVLNSGCTLTVPAGISVTEGNTLTIQGDGNLIVGNSKAAEYTGIGADGHYGIHSCGTINIKDGHIEAYGGGWAAGIGGSNSATDSNTGVINITGGTVKAHGGEYAAGIGGGRNSTVQKITITSGTVTADTSALRYSVPGIGVGYGANNSCEIVISGGNVTASSSNSDGAGIGGDSNSSATVNFSTGTNGTAVIKTTGRLPDEKTKVNGELSGFISELNGKVTTVYGNQTLKYNLTINNGETLIIPKGSKLTIPSGMEITNNGIIAANGTIEGTANIKGNIPTKSVTVTFLAGDGGEGDMPKQTHYVNNTYKLPVCQFTKNDHFFVGWKVDNGEVKQAGTEIQLTGDVVLTAQWKKAEKGFVNSDNTEWANGTYTVNSDVTLNNRVDVVGEVHLILTEGTTLIAPYGIGVDSTAKLIIDGTGTLKANGYYKENGASNKEYGAAIGGTYAKSRNDKNCGSITILNGIISINTKAVGDVATHSAGIGGAIQSADGTITIKGGDITVVGDAVGGAYEEYAIGSGDCGKGKCDIVIEGGKITTTGYDKHGSIGGQNTNFSTGENGHAIIQTNDITDKNKQDSWKVIVSTDGGNTFTVHGNVTLTDNLEIKNGKKLIVPKDSSLTVPKGKTITNSGVIEIQTGGKLDLSQGGMLDGTKPDTSGGGIYIPNHPTECTVTFNANGHSTAPAEQQIKYQNKIGNPGNLSAEGYTFGGWYKDAECNNKWDFDKDLALNHMTLYAKWTPIDYTITYEGIEGATNTNPDTYNIEREDITLNAPTKPGYTFAGWTYDGQKEPIKDNVVIATGSTGNKTFTANWTANTYIVNFDGNGGALPSETTMDAQNFTVGISQKLTKNKFVREGYDFIGWSTSSGEQNVTYKDEVEFDKKDTTQGETITLYAQWKIKEYTISFDEKSVDPIIASFGTSVSAPMEPTKEGYTFDGWFEKENGEFAKEAYEFTTMPAKDIELFAKWTINQYNITFNLNGGKGTFETITQDYNSEVTAPTEEPTKVGYTFDGWFEKENGEFVKDAYEFTTMPAKDVNLFAKWTPIEYTITYNGLENAENSSNNPAKYNIETNTITLVAPTKAGYEFAGWVSDSQAVTEIAKGSTGNKVLTANWTLAKPAIPTIEGNATSIYPDKVILTANFTEIGTDYLDYTYQWYKGEQLIKNATGKTLELAKVADSGEYKVEVTVAETTGDKKSKTTSDKSVGKDVTISKGTLQGVEKTARLEFQKKDGTVEINLKDLLPKVDGVAIAKGTEGKDTSHIISDAVIENTTVKFTVANQEGTATWNIPVSSDNYETYNIVVTLVSMPNLSQTPITIEGNLTGTFGKEIKLNVVGGSNPTGEVTCVVTDNNGVVGEPVIDGRNITLTPAKAGTFTITATLAGGNVEGKEYAAVTSKEYTVTVNPAKATGTPKVTFNKPQEERAIKVSDYAITTEGLTPNAGKIVWKTPDAEVVAGEKYEWSFDPTDKEKYAVTTGIIVLKEKPIPTPGGGGGAVTPEPEKPVVPEVKPDIEKPILPVEPPKEGANIGIDKEQQAETDQTIKDIVNDIVKPADPEQKPDPEKPQIPQTEAEKETAATEQKIAEAAKDKDTTIKVEVKTDKIVEDKAPVEVKKEIAEIKEVVKKNFEEAGTKLLQLVNIDVTAQAVKNGVTTELGNLRNLGKELTFTFVIPDNTDGKKLAVVRYHDGVAEIIPSTCEGNKIVFKTDKFSTYALVEYDKVATPEPEQPVKPGVVQNVNIDTDNGLFKVTFDKLDNATNYRVYVTKAGENNWRWFKADNGSALVKQLYKKPIEKNGKYQIKVVAYNETVKGDASDIHTIYANRIGTKSAKMYAPKFNSITFAKNRANTTTAKVIAKKVYVKNTPKNLQYKVSYRLKGTKTWKSAGYNAKNVKYIKGLKKGKVYTFAVRYRYQSAVDGKTNVYSNVIYKSARVK